MLINFDRFIWHSGVATCNQFRVEPHALETVLPVVVAGLVPSRSHTCSISPPRHAAFSGAEATALGKYFPDKATTVQAMAEEAAMSRLIGGIHYRFDNDDGLLLGRRVAVRVIERYGR